MATQVEARTPRHLKQRQMLTVNMDACAESSDATADAGNERERRTAISAVNHEDLPSIPRQWLVWALSFGIWTLISVVAGVTLYHIERSMGKPVSLLDELKSPLTTGFPYALVSPFVFAFSIRNPFQRANWKRVAAIQALGIAAMLGVHVLVRAAALPVWTGDGRVYAYSWNFQARILTVRWDLIRQLFLLNSVDDILEGYLPVVLIANALWYYQSFRSRERRTLQLETQLAKAHLETLRSQLQPHFLFNTLHSISALMMTDVRSADKMMTRLSDLLRMSLDNGGRQLTILQQEMEFVNAYLEIEKIRFADRLKIHVDIAPEVLDAEVPSLLLQPLVENAIRHGVARLSRQGEIHIAAKADSESLQIRIRDNGPGLEQGNVQVVGTHLGLKTTRERLRTLYGNQQTLEVRNVPGGGVEVSVRIPFRFVAMPALQAV